MCVVLLTASAIAAPTPEGSEGSEADAKREKRGGLLVGSGLGRGLGYGSLGYGGLGYGSLGYGGLGHGLYGSGLGYSGYGYGGGLGYSGLGYGGLGYGGLGYNGLGYGSGLINHAQLVAAPAVAVVEVPKASLNYSRLPTVYFLYLF